jgi:microcystin-dependent protein
VPDLRGRVPAVVNSGAARLPSWADSLGGTGGEKEHTLITAEIPAHTHTDTGHSHLYTSPVLGLPTLTGAQPASIPSPLPGATSSGNANLTNTGGDGAHNNVQPTIALYAYILAGL